MSVQKSSYTAKKTGKTTVRYYANVWNPAEKRSVIGPMRSTEKLARQDETDLQRAVAAGKAKAAPRLRKMRVDDVYAEWHRATAKVYAYSTWKVYERFYRTYIADVFGQRAIAEITPIHCQRYVSLMSERYSPETVNKCFNILIDIFNFSVDVLKCRPDNPAAGIRKCKVPRKQKVTWTDEQTAAFLSAPEVRESHYYPMLCLSAMLGMRPGEVCGLREDCLREDGCIEISRGYDNDRQETDLKTSGSHRTPPLPDALHKIIRRRLIWKKKMRLENPEWGANDFLFVSQNGIPIKPHQYANAFRRLLRQFNAEAGKVSADGRKAEQWGGQLPEITLYGLRTSFATNAMRRLPNAAVISSVMGNSPKTLLQFYAQTDKQLEAEVVQKALQDAVGD